MAKCEFCKKDMGKAESCGLKFWCIKVKDEILPRDTNYFDYNDKCHDCGIENRAGNIHHFGCDIERCPKCGEQIIGCDCVKEIGVNGKWVKI